MDKEDWIKVFKEAEWSAFGDSNWDAERLFRYLINALEKI